MFYLFFPTYEQWLNRSPHTRFGNHDESRDDSSFCPNLLNGSFDTISDAGGSTVHNEGKTSHLGNKGQMSFLFMSPPRSWNSVGTEQRKSVETPKNQKRETSGHHNPYLDVHSPPNANDVFHADISPIPLHPDPSFDDTSRQIGALSLQSHKPQEDGSFRQVNPTGGKDHGEGKPRNVSLLEHDRSVETSMKDSQLNLPAQMTLESPFRSSYHPQFASRMATTCNGETSCPTWAESHIGQHASMTTPSRNKLSYSVHSTHSGSQYESFSSTDSAGEMQRANHQHSPMLVSNPPHPYSGYYQRHIPEQYPIEPYYNETGPEGYAFPLGNFASNAAHNPSKVLCTLKSVFEGCKYRLRCVLETEKEKRDENMKEFQLEIDKKYLKRARSRVQSALCAFGGHALRQVKEENGVNCSDAQMHKLKARKSEQSKIAPKISENSSNSKQKSKKKGQRETSSIFRQTQRPPLKNESDNTGSGRKRKQKTTRGSLSYDDILHQRYTVTATRISWEVEADPPISVPSDVVQSKEKKGKKKEATTRPELGKGKLSQKESSEANSSNEKPSVSSKGQQKAKYRCKLCGKPKNNHVCPYDKSAQRTIAVMVRPTINAFTTDEPAGVLTPSLSEMNNFVAYGSHDFSCDGDNDSGRTETHSHDQLSSLRKINNGGVVSRVTPDIRSHGRQTTTQQGSSPRPPTSGFIPGSYGSLSQGGRDQIGNLKPEVILKLRNEQFRAVSSSKVPNRDGNDASLFDVGDDGYDYPHIPLTFHGRKVLSDTLFFMAKKVPSFTTEVALMLRTARGKDDWDQAVAELMTQVIVGLFCTEDDHELNGLRDYLRSIGICA